MRFGIGVRFAGVPLPLAASRTSFAARITAPSSWHALMSSTSAVRIKTSSRPTGSASLNGKTATRSRGAPSLSSGAAPTAPGYFNDQTNNNFSIEWDAAATVNLEDAICGLSFGQQSAPSGYACILRFAASGNLDVRNGGAYSSTATVPYTANQTFHVRMAVRISNHTYDVFVTPQGQSEILLASNFAFRTDQASIATLDYLSSNGGVINLSNMVGPSQMALAPVVANQSFSLSTSSGFAANEVVGTMTALYEPTSWAITAGNSAGNFALSVHLSGDFTADIIVTSAGATNLANQTGTATLTIQATNATGTSANATATISYSGATVADGSTGAPAGAAQFPTLLSGYAFRPSWKVAGVDYRVGFPSGQVFKVPGVNALPSGASFSGGTVTVTGNNVTLDGWDLMTNKYTLQINNGVSGLRVTNSKHYHIFNPTATSVSNIYIAYCEISSGGDDVQSWIDFFGNVTNLQVEYCYLHTAGNDGIGIQSDGEITYIRYCVLDSPGLLTGTHGDMTQIQGAITGAGYNIYYNLVRYTSGSTQGLMCENSPNGVTSGNVHHNTMIAGGGQPNAMVAVTVADIASGGLFQVHDNYYDITNGQNFSFNNSTRGGANDGSTKTVWVNNVNMNNGNKESLANDTPPGTP